ncbi:MAG: hypothetical protein H6R14_894 [Proteobacteria bacterium]|nr:hypothetical protein [Pseudomonadota bacterium]
MKKSLLVAAMLTVALTACNKKEESVATLPPAVAAPSLPPPATAPVLPNAAVTEETKAAAAPAIATPATPATDNAGAGAR